MEDRRPVRALSREGVILAWDFEGYTEAISLAHLLSDLVNRIKRLEQKGDFMEELSWRCYNSNCGHTVETHINLDDLEPTIGDWRKGLVKCSGCHTLYEVMFNGVTLFIDPM
jgi:hypothetical protein